MSFRSVRRWAKRLGQRGENAAARLLRDEGCSILARNCRMPHGELDIVARDGVSLVFVEVKTRFRRRFSSAPGTAEWRPSWNLRPAQKRRIYRSAIVYLRELEDPPLPFRFDLIEVIAGPSGIKSILHHQQIFDRKILAHSPRRKGW